jgi:hypothetical protein
VAEVGGGVVVRLGEGLPRREQRELRAQQPGQLQLLPPPLRHDALRRLDVAQLRHAQPRVEQLVLRPGDGRSRVTEINPQVLLKKKLNLHDFPEIDLTSAAEVAPAMVFSMRALANRHCSSRPVSTRARCAASSFSGSSFLRAAITSRSAPDDPRPAASSDPPVALRRRLLVVGSHGPLAATPGSGKDRRSDGRRTSAPAPLLFSLQLIARRGGSGALGGGILWAKEAALRRDRVKLAVDAESGVARMPSYTKAPEPARDAVAAAHGRRDAAVVRGRGDSMVDDKYRYIYIIIKINKLINISFGDPAISALFRRRPKYSGEEDP